MHTVTKSYRDFPAAHRQPDHDGHCRLIHGHNWGFDITFAARELDSCGFVVDVGKLQVVKQYLTDMFDHTLLINHEDPLRDEITKKLSGLANIVFVPNCGMEGLAKLVYASIQEIVWSEESFASRGLVVTQVICFEDSKNSSTYCPE